MSEITVVGSFVMDNVAKMKRFPSAGETIIGESLRLYPGGKGANQCVAIARLGGDVEMIGMLGRDGAGETFRKILKDEGIKAGNVFACDEPTAVAQVQTDETGQNRICVIPSANYEFGLKEIEKIDGVLRNTKTLVLQLELRLDVTKELIRRAHGYGVRIILNPAPATMLDDDILSKVDYITPNESELSLLTGLPTDTEDEVAKAAAALIGRGVGNVVATLGSKGAMIVTKDKTETVAGYKVKAVDTVAAGDSFNGALAVRLTEGESLFESVRFANAMGALTVQKEGAIPSLHTRKEVEKFMKEHR